MLRALRELKGRRARKFMKMIKQFGLIKALRCAYRLDTYSKTLLSPLSRVVIHCIVANFEALLV